MGATVSLNEASRPLDVLGIGFGPSNLALAIALHDAGREGGADLACRFLERQDGFVWHGNMLLDGSRMQISFLKDLVSMRDPTSPYSFLNYLHVHGRLQDFINLRTFYPTRREFNDYLAWVAGHFSDRCDYGEEVVALEPDAQDGRVHRLRVRARNQAGRERAWLARNVVIGVGATPRVPDAFIGTLTDARVIHSSTYLAAAEALARAGRVAVVGFGQSAAEIFLDLHARGVAVDLIARSPAMRPADSSPFVNQIFDPAYTDYHYGQRAEERDRILREFQNTNYAVVDPDLIETVYGMFYQQKVERVDRHRLLPRHEVREVRLTSGPVSGPASGTDGVLLDLLSLDDGERRIRRYGGVVLATGYHRQQHHRLLEPLAPWLTGEGVRRDYRLATTGACTAGVFLQGCCEPTHGLSDTLLSVLPIRAREITAALAAPYSGAGVPERRTVAHAF
ncbi:lysine/ornithine N-monooxygenase [Nitrospirillum viridazoti Y2]|uniref:L-ornithine N5-oxygenase n=1 Tax=Nitrospirillum amazonense TaxID=28077 RepID=A0A560IIK0_9PROT|nr:lysine N(6)-hydroxylase/L-ornithine N(5)-oxygenase family protein [Nitrospirillum amazonense]EGY00466.1 lysine/ornithine N-monooxygenase [Nitrospirillum amazonense Y2]TWB56610.1 L-ornithine N5-oxygenase [Nitrospirillum amazonense]